MANNPVITNKKNAVKSVANPSWVISSGNPGMASHSNRSADKNTANDANINNSAILIIKMATGAFSVTGRYCTQLFIKRLNPKTYNILNTCI
jgi:hypothetical protein